MKGFIRISLAILLSGVACAAVAACDDDTTPSTTPDAAVETPDSSDPAPTEAGADAKTDAATDAASDAPVATNQTALVSAINNVSRPLDRAQFGDEHDDAGVQHFHLEAHSGGQPECPSETSPSPDRTLIVTNVPRGAPGTKYTRDDGVRVIFFDFLGEQIQGPKSFTSATSITVTIVAIGSGEKPEDVELEVDATFPEGKVTGRVYATYCQSLSK